jgi:hypothetical protein
MNAAAGLSPASHRMVERDFTQRAAPPDGAGAGGAALPRHSPGGRGARTREGDPGAYSRRIELTEVAA